MCGHEEMMRKLKSAFLFFTQQYLIAQNPDRTKIIERINTAIHFTARGKHVWIWLRQDISDFLFCVFQDDIRFTIR